MQKLQVLIPLLAALAAASERLVDALKSLIPFLQSPTTKAAQLAANPKKDQIREGIIGLLSILIAIATVWMAEGANIFPTNANPFTGKFGHDFLTTILVGLLVAGGSRLWNPLVEWMKAIKDAKKP